MMSRRVTVLASLVTLFLLINHYYYFLYQAKPTTGAYVADKVKSFDMEKEMKMQAEFEAMERMKHEMNTGSQAHPKTLKEASTPLLSMSTFDQTSQEGEIQLTRGKIPIDDFTSIPYVHSGPTYSSSGATRPKELLLLHGMKFTKETWVKHEIISTMSRFEPSLSITAVDLAATADGTALVDLFNGLVKANLLSGQPVFILSPSASGKSVVDLLEMSMLATAEEAENEPVVPQILRGWIPVACGKVQSTSNDVLDQINKFRIPILALYGDLDTSGRVTSQKLKEIGMSNVEVIEMQGGHPVYLDDTAKFINFVILFINQIMEKRK